MVLGLIDFLLGGKKKAKVPKSGQVVTPLTSVGGSVNGTTATTPGTVNANGTISTTENASGSINSNSNDMKFQSSIPQSNGDSNVPNTNSNVHPQTQQGVRKPISEVISKMHGDLKNTTEKMSEIVTEIKEIQNNVSSLGHRIDDIEEAKKETDEKMAQFDRNMTKFLSLYELINNQYNPFVDQDATPKKIVVNSDGSSEEDSDKVMEKENFTLDKDFTKEGEKGDLDATFLNLDTLNIEEAAGDAVPLVSLKNNTNSLVTILSWLEYLIKRVGVEETRNSLRYYTETLRWITPEVFFDLDKYLRGMKDKPDLTGNESLTIRDHIVSLYFISKLNEKVLDSKLTNAVLQIIKE